MYFKTTTRLLKIEIKINASSEKVCSIFTDLERYGEWNHFIKNAQGKVQVEQRLEVLISPPKSKEIVLKPVVKSVIENSEFIWLGRFLFPGIFDGEHIFNIESLGDQKLLVQKENFSGILVPMIWSSLNTNTRVGFELMNKALKERPESK